MPVPQVFVQVLQEFQLSTQSTGQGWVLQLRLEFMLSQERPPWALERRTDRVRVSTPPPHFSVQPDDADQLEVLQSIGQAKLLQLRYLYLVGLQALPPLRGLVIIEREAHCEPPWQELVQGDQALQADTMQCWVG